MSLYVNKSYEGSESYEAKMISKELHQKGFKLLIAFISVSNHT